MPFPTLFEGLFSPSLLSNYSTCLFPPWHCNSVFSYALVSPEALEKTPIGAEQIPSASRLIHITHNPGWEALVVTPTKQRGGSERLSFIWSSEFGFLSSTLSLCNIVSDHNSSNKSNHRTELLRVTGCQVPCWLLPTDYLLFIFMMVLRQVLLWSAFCRCGNWGRVRASCPRPQVF